MLLWHTIAIITTSSWSKAYVDTFVVVADVSVFVAVLARCTFHFFTANQWIAEIILWTGALGLVFGCDAGGVHATDRGIIATVTAFWNTGHLNAGGRVGTIGVAVVADIRFMATWVFVRVADQILRTFATIGTRLVFAN